ncbi:MAG: uL13 family ribosomal protein [Candidatus Pacebacteria bacterium]|nr:uL13 family ribosomal protein [Candidatus Paceibacterota bacterium]MCF7857073.1 uL13 family ribosomal protein [Candidatus Paceibacterota bacterium]
MEKKEYTIDATSKRLGRVATEAATILLGKNSTSFAKNIVQPVTVTITNVSKLDISDKKRDTEFQSYSGYPGGRRVENLDHLANRLGYDEVVRRVISGMIPKNKLHTPRMLNLIVTE